MRLQGQSSARGALDVAASLAMIAAGGAVLWATFGHGISSRPGKADVPIPKESQPLQGGLYQGAAEAPVVLIEYSDFQCPYCGRFARETLPLIEKNYVATGRLAVVFRHLPIESHPRANSAAAVAECARAQGKGWEMHDLMFAHQGQLEEADLFRYATELRLQDAPFRRCIAEGPDAITHDSGAAKKLGVSVTPTFLVGVRSSATSARITHVVMGARPYSEFVVLLDQVQQEATKARD
jgi:protein-disulfide isomerase